MFLGWYDPDKKRPATQKLMDAINRYRERFGADPVACITSPEDAEELQGAEAVTVKGVHYIPRFTFYVGVEE